MKDIRYRFTDPIVMNKEITYNGKKVGTLLKFIPIESEEIEPGPNYYTPSFEEIRNNYSHPFIFDYVAYQFITTKGKRGVFNYRKIETHWHTFRTETLIPFHDDHLKELIETNHIRALKKNVKVDVYIENPWWVDSKDIVVSLPFYLAKLKLQSSLYPGQVQLLGVTNSNFTKKPMIIREYTKRTGCFYKTSTLRDLLKNNYGLIFSFPDIPEVKVLPEILFGIRVNYTPFVFLNGTEQRKLGLNNSLYKKWFNIEKYIDPDQRPLWKDWRNALDLDGHGAKEPDNNTIGDYVIGFIKYTMNEKTFGTFKCKVIEKSEQLYLN